MILAKGVDSSIEICSKGTQVRKIRIGNRSINDAEPTFIIAEAGVNHNGRIGLGKKLIDVAKGAGADAVKFQSFKTENMVTRKAPKADYQKGTTGTRESQYEMIKKLELCAADSEKLALHAQKSGIIFLSTPFDKGSSASRSRTRICPGRMRPW